MRVLVTGANGFIANNLLVRLAELPDVQILEHNKLSPLTELKQKIENCDCIVHLAGVNRPDNTDDFQKFNGDLTKTICELASQADNKPYIIFSSSTQAALDNKYGNSKVFAEDALHAYSRETHSPVYIYRLPNVMGKWCRPNYNSVVATFCHNIANNLPIKINDPESIINLVYIDDVVDEFIRIILENPDTQEAYSSIKPEYNISIGELAEYLYGFRDSRKALYVDDVGTGFIRALYSTYISYYPEKDFSYEVPVSIDERGSFVEMIKTRNSGQISFFTCHPGLTRGSHYHHTKTEKFLVLQGNANFRFKNLHDSRIHEIAITGQQPRIVESIPGWVHDITNTGEEELIVMIWANEVFNQDKPDTVQADVINE